MAKPLRVLIIEDSEKDAALLLRQLRGGGYDPSFERVDTLETMVSAISNSTWDILISDHSMPHFSAIQALETIKERNLDIPVIILSGTIEEEKAVEAMRAGASDYIMKGKAARLLPAIERELREAEARRKARKVEEQFRQAQKMEAIGRLAGGVAHDFNNLLTAILGNCSFLVDGIKRGNPDTKDVEDIRAAGERAAALTRQLLAFSRKQVLEVRVLDLNAVVASMDRLLRRLIGEDIELTMAAGNDLGRIKADQGQIEQVIMNLAVNARDAMPDGGKLKIETANTTLDETSSGGQFEVKPGPYVTLLIADTGCGMDDKVLSHLFEPFFTTKEMGKGTGLGLSTVYGIVKQSSAYIWINSAPGRGTTFKICFPLVKEAAEPVASPERTIKSLRGSETILLVEDDERVRNLTRRILTQQGYKVLPTADGTEALRVCDEHKGDIHLLVTDVVMPRVSGGELARQILQTRAGIKVLYISGYTDNVIAHQGVLKPGIHFLQKPFTPEGLARKMREVLEARIS
ncbi:MAG: response regulator [Elusimicrobia bacterium]|nr:response regulator [Elusimicrobiota bacterium]